MCYKHCCLFDTYLIWPSSSSKSLETLQCLELGNFVWWFCSPNSKKIYIYIYKYIFSVWPLAQVHSLPGNPKYLQLFFKHLCYWFIHWLIFFLQTSFVPFRNNFKLISYNNFLWFFTAMKKNKPTHLKWLFFLSLLRFCHFQNFFLTPILILQGNLVFFQSQDWKINFTCTQCHGYIQFKNWTQRKVIHIGF